MRYAVLLLCLPLLAQEPTARIEGRVIDGEGRPVARATVRVGLMTDRQPHTIQSGEDGRFVAADLAPVANYTLIAQKPGYLTAALGANASSVRSAPPPPFALAPGEIARVELRMIEQGIITGTITNQSGDAVGQATVVLWQEIYRLGIREKNYVRIARTDDRGVYRFAELPAGRYFVISGETSAGSARESEANLTTYFGQTQDLQRASSVQITPGGEARADIALLRGAVHTLRGKVTDASGAPLAQRAVSVRRNGDVAFTTRATGPTGADGSFEIHDLMPGEHVVDVEPRLGSGAVIMGTTDVSDLVVSIPTGVAVQGTVRIEDGEWTPEAQQRRVGPALAEQLLIEPAGIVRTPFIGFALEGSPITGSYATEIRADAQFEIKGVASGEYQFVAGGFPETYYVKSVRMGDNDVTHAPVRIPGGPLTVVVSTKGAEVAGTLPRDGLSVALWPETEKLGPPLHGIRVVNSGKDGTFVLRGLAPGAYRVAAFDTSEPGILWNHAFLDRFAGVAVRVELKEGSKVKAEPPLIPNERFNEELRKLP